MAVVVAFGAAGAGNAWADEPPPRHVAKRRGTDLGRCLHLADRNHPQLLEARAKLSEVRAQLSEAHSAPFMAFRAVGGLAVAPTVRGSNVFSPNTDQSLTSNLGVAWQASISGVLPIWTFGKITSLWEAAEANVNLNQAAVDVARDSIRFDVRKAYYGLQLARDGLDLLKDAESKIGEALEQLEQKVEEDDADPIDLLKLQTFAAELEARRSEAERYERIALAGLRFYTGVASLDIPDTPIRPPEHRLGTVQRYIDASRLHRPEMRMARAGITARRAQLDMSRANMFPDIGLALQFGFSTAPEVANQINPFVTDPGNYFRYGAALVAQWQLDVLPKLARIEQAEARLDQVMALDRKAVGGVAAEVHEAYAEVLDWQKRRAAFRKASRYAKQWLSTVQQAIDVGTMEDKDLIDPAKSWAQHRYNSLNATMELNLAMAKLAKVTGWDAIAPLSR
jgi:outer membrane protein TolC